MIRLRPKEWSVLRALAVAGCVGLFATACGSPAYVDRSQPRGMVEEVPAPIVDAVVFERDPALEDDPPRCIAVLPFAAEGEGEPDAETATKLDAVRRAFHAHLAPQNRRDVDPWRVDAVLAAMPENRRRDWSVLGSVLRCDALLVGTMTTYRRVFLGLYSRVQVGAEVTLIRARDGRVLWQGSHRAASHGGSVPISLPGIALGVLDAATNMRDEQLNRVAEDLARRLVATIPDPPAPDGVDPETLRALAAFGALDPTGTELGDYGTAGGE